MAKIDVAFRKPEYKGRELVFPSDSVLYTDLLPLIYSSIEICKFQLHK